METKHTKGEWVITPSKLIVVDKKDNIIADCDWTTETYFTKEEMEANTKLVAAAPDLLEALIELKVSMDTTIRWTNGGLKSLSLLEQERYKTICNAINKATK